MKIFADEFINWIKQNTVCKFQGHKSSKWMKECWAIAHYTGFEVRRCERCNKELERRNSIAQMEVI